MFKKLVIASVIMAATSSVAFAGHHARASKGEDLKNEMPAPCPTYQYVAGPYLGLSIGPRINYTSTPTNYSGLEATLSGGYAAMLDPSWYLAGELFVADSASLRDNKFTPAVGPTVGSRTTWSYGASIIPGYMITDHVLGFLRLGYVNSRFSDQSTRKGGYQVGLGTQTNLYQNWDMRTEYVYSGYSSVSGIGTPRSGQFNIGLVYKFV